MAHEAAPEQTSSESGPIAPNPVAVAHDAAPSASPPTANRFIGYAQRTFASLGLRDFRLLLAGNIITQFGTWFQNIGMNWLVWVVTENAFTMGSLQAWRGVTTLFISPFAGVWADRMDRRTLLIIFTAFSALEASLLAFLVYTGLITPGSSLLDRLLQGTLFSFLVSSGITKAWVFFLFALADGLVNSLMMPTRQAFVYDVAGREHVANAIALNASIGNLARALGPNLAGAIIGFFGIYWAFIVRAGAIWSSLLFTLRISPRPRLEAPRRRETTWREFLEGLRYVRSDRLILGLIAAEVLLPFLIYPYIQFLPVFARDVLGGGAEVYGALASGVGIGAIPGGIFLASLGNFRRRGQLLLVAGWAYMGSVLLFSQSRSFPLSWGLLILAGVFWVMTTSLVQALIQLYVRTDVRARTVALYSMGNSALQPLGSLAMGATIAAIGPQMGVAAFALTAMMALGAITVLVPELRKA